MMNMKQSVLALVVASVGLVPSVWAEEVQLAKDGRALAKIVVAKDADKSARFAAQELQHHLKLITGAEFPVVTDAAFGGTGVSPVQEQKEVMILVGETALSKVKNPDFKLQEWLVDVSPKRIVLAGRDKDDKGAFTLEYDTPIGIQGKGWPDFYDEQGTMYAVYDFLEKECGVIWADAEDDGTVIRKNPNLSVAVTSRRRQPFVFYRGGSATGDVDNSFFNRNTPRFKEYRQLAYSHPKTIRQQNRLFLLRHRAGGRLANANHSFGAFWDRFLHKDSKRFESYHPEYFAKGYVGKDPPQLCFGSQAVVDQVVKDIRAYFDQDPKTGRFNWGRDNYCLEGADNGSFCLCDICRPQYEEERSPENGRESTYWFGFVKRVADEILKSHPDKQISTLAYHSHEALPHGVKLPKNVVVYFCLYANRMPYAKVFNDQMERISSWRAAYPEQPMALWLYNTFPKENAIKAGFDFYPAFFAPDAYRQYQFFKEKNIRAGIFQCGLNGAPDTYMQLCWMLDPDRTPDELLDEYFACYGKVGPHLKEFYNLVAARYADRSRFPKGGVMHQTVHLAWGKLGTKDLMDRLAAAMAKAEAAAETPAEKRRLAVWRYGVWDFMQGGFNAYAERQSHPKPEWSAPRIASAAGDVAKVDWTKIPAEPISFYNSNTGDKTHLSGTVRWAHDGQWLYLELAHTADCPKLHVTPAIFQSDTWELFVAGQEGLPYRHYFSCADGRIEGMSNGEVNWRQNVMATESGPSAFGAKCASDCGDPAKWVQRIAFPLDNLIERPLKPGDVFYVNPVRVCSKGQYREGESFIQSVVPCATIHTTDRMARVTLQK